MTISFHPIATILLLVPPCHSTFLDQTLLNQHIQSGLKSRPVQARGLLKSGHGFTIWKRLQHLQHHLLIHSQVPFCFPLMTRNSSRRHTLKRNQPAGALLSALVHIQAP